MPLLLPITNPPEYALSNPLPPQIQLYQVFLFVRLNFQLDKPEFGEHKREVIPARGPSSNSLIGVRRIDTETGKYSS